MNQSDVLFLVAFVILLGSLIAIIVPFVRSRRRGGSDEGRGGDWWEGPWDEGDGKR